MTWLILEDELSGRNIDHRVLKNRIRLSSAVKFGCFFPASTTGISDHDISRGKR